MSAAVLVVLAALGGGFVHAAAEDPIQTRFPGQVTAGGGTSGEVMGRSGELRRVPDEAGTPGIPQGAEGNTAGPKLGAGAAQSTLGGTGTRTQPSQASKALQAEPPASGASPVPAASAASGASSASLASVASAASSASAPAAAGKALEASPPASSPSKTYAEKKKSAQAAAKTDLPQTEDRIAALWRGAHGNARGHVETQAAPTTPRSEKLGNAPPSADVKQPKPGASGAAR